MSLHCLNTELSAELTALVDCSPSAWAEIEDKWVSAPDIESFKTWFAANYVEKEDYFVTPLYVVHIKKA